MQPNLLEHINIFQTIVLNQIGTKSEAKSVGIEDKTLRETKRDSLHVYTTEVFPEVQHTLWTLQWRHTGIRMYQITGDLIFSTAWSSLYYTKKTSKLRITGPFWGESTSDLWIPVTSEFPKLSQLCGKHCHDVIMLSRSGRRIFFTHFKRHQSKSVMDMRMGIKTTLSVSLHGQRRFDRNKIFISISWSET